LLVISDNNNTVTIQCKEDHILKAITLEIQNDWQQ